MFMFHYNTNVPFNIPEPTITTQTPDMIKTSNDWPISLSPGSTEPSDNTDANSTDGKYQP